MTAMQTARRATKASPLLASIKRIFKVLTATKLLRGSLKMAAATTKEGQIATSKLTLNEPNGATPRESTLRYGETKAPYESLLQL